MSAFIVDASCMTKVVTAALHFMNETRRPIAGHKTGYHPADELRRHVGTEIGRVLYELNRQAIVARYRPAAVEELGGIPAFEYAEPGTELEHIDAIALFKACDCLSYQCAEGDVDRTPLYAELMAVAGWLASRVVRRLPAYDRAPWGD